MKNTWRLIYLSIPLTAAVFAGIMAHNAQKGPELCEGVGRVPEAVRYAAEAEAVEEEAAEYRLDSYTEGEGPAPVWWDPDEPMAAEWEEPKNADLVLTVEEEPEVVTRDIGCPDWNADSTMYGWDGHSMEAWEMDLFARVFYLEFWQPDMVLCEAGCDAILQLWDLNGGTMFDTLSAITENGAYAFSTWPDVWATEYDADGLAWCRAYCEERFYSGPEWIAQYFRKGYYHDWGEWSPDPAYEIGGIFFSVARG